MQGIQEWFSQYWMYALGVVGALIVFLIVLKMASKSYKRYYKNYHAQEKEIKRLIELKGKYKDLTAEAIAQAEKEELLEGAALSYQLKLQKEEDMEKAFSLLEKEKQYIYALDVFVSEKSVSDFFRENGKILTEITVPALNLIGLYSVAEETEKMRLMFDETDETTSISQKEIQRIEELFKAEEILTKIKHKAAEYIKENPELFI